MILMSSHLPPCVQIGVINGPVYLDLQHAPVSISTDRLPGSPRASGYRVALCRVSDAMPVFVTPVWDDDESLKKRVIRTLAHLEAVVLGDYDGDPDAAALGDDETFREIFDNLRGQVLGVPYWTENGEAGIDLPMNDSDPEGGDTGFVTITNLTMGSFFSLNLVVREIERALGHTPSEVKDVAYYEAIRAAHNVLDIVTNKSRRPEDKPII